MSETPTIRNLFTRLLLTLLEVFIGIFVFITLIIEIIPALLNALIRKMNDLRDYVMSPKKKIKKVKPKKSKRPAKKKKAIKPAARQPKGNEKGFSSGDIKKEIETEPEPVPPKF